MSDADFARVGRAFVAAFVKEQAEQGIPGGVWMPDQMVATAEFAAKAFVEEPKRLESTRKLLEQRDRAIELLDKNAEVDVKAAAYEVLTAILERVKTGQAVTLEPDWADGKHYTWTLDVVENFDDAATPQDKRGWHTHCAVHEPNLGESIRSLRNALCGGPGLTKVRTEAAK